VYIDNSFEPRFFWIPALRMYTLLLLTAVDIGLSGRAPPTAHGAVLRCVLSIIVVFIFTVLVLLPCPYHRIDRWNIAKRLALLVLSIVGSAMTLMLTFAEIQSNGAKNSAGSDDSAAPYLAATNVFATMLIVLLPILFVGVLLAFLLSRGTGCCARSWKLCVKCVTRTAGEDADTDESKSGETVEMVDQASVVRGLDLRLSLSGIEEFHAVKKSPRTSSKHRLTGMLRGSISRHSKQHLMVEEEVDFDDYVNPFDGSKPIKTDATLAPLAQVSNPLVRKLNPTSGGASSTNVDITLNGSSSNSSSSDEDDQPRFVKWRARKRAAGTLGDALYSFGSASDVRRARLKITEHIESMFHGAAELSVSETLKLLRTRAKGSNLGGNMHIQLTLVQRSSSDVGDSIVVTPSQFAEALHASVKDEPNGAVAEWLINELTRAEAGERKKSRGRSEI
jgi:hypothetical protein